MVDIHSLSKTTQSQTLESTETASADQNILLICIVNYKRYNITFEFLYNLFSQFGEVRKVFNVFCHI